MNRFTLFTLFLSTIIVVIAAEIMVNEYLRPYGTDGAANVFQSQQTSTPPSANQNQTAASTSNPAAGSLHADMLPKAGLQDYTLQTAQYGGKLFGRLALNDLSFIPTFESHLVKNQVARVASFYEFSTGSEQSAKEFYDLLKQRCSSEIGVILNETNSFGNGSFYVNYFEFPDKVFIVFRKGTRIFAFNYTKELHGSMTKLVGLL